LWTAVLIDLSFALFVAVAVRDLIRIGLGFLLAGFVVRNAH
jgi:hypothetical protein